MSVVFACAVSHAPGLKAWTDRASPELQETLFGGFDKLKARLAAAKVDHLIVFTSEHWTNFFLDHMSAFCIGRAESYSGPVEPWLKMEQQRIPGDPAFASALIEACYANDMEVGFAEDLQFDHGTILPLHYLGAEAPVTPIYFNTLAPPQPSPRRALALGRIIGDVAAKSKRRIGLVATGGMSHDPGERNHGVILEDFDRTFIDRMQRADLDALGKYTLADFAAAGAGSYELLAWIALAGALQKYKGELISYAPVKAWATGMGLMAFEPAGATG